MSNEYKRQHDKDLEELFGSYKEPIDWAEQAARDAVCTTFNNLSLDFTLRRFAEELLGIKDFESKSAKKNLAFLLSITLAGELRQIRGHLLSTFGPSPQRIVDQKMEAIRKQIMSPESTARQVRKYAESLDGRGYSEEANVLRDAATILEEDL